MSNNQDEIIETIKQITKNLGSGLYLRDKESAELLFCNERFAEIHGYEKAEEVKGIKTWDLIDPEWKNQVVTYLQENSHYEGIGTAFTRNRERIHINLTILEIPRTSLILGIVRNVTKQIEMEAKLVKSEAKYRALVDTIQEGLIIVNQNEEIVFTNPAICKSLSFSESELIGKNLADITTVEQFQIILEETEKRKNGITNQYEVRLNSKTQIEKKFLISAAPLFDANTNYAGSIAICMDIGHRHLTQPGDVELPKIYLDLLLKELSDQLLRARGWLDILKSSSKLGDKERINNVQNSLLKIDFLSKQVKEVFFCPSNGMKLSITLSNLISKVKEGLTNLVIAKSIELIFETFAQELKDGRVPLLYSQIIEQILYNSISRNARKITISIIKIDLSKINIIIEDDAKSFVTSEEKEEFLLGIYLSVKLIESMSNSLTVDYILPGEGTRFVISSDIVL